MDIFSIFFKLKVRCVFSLESPYEGDSNEHTQCTIFIIKKKITLDFQICMGLCSKGPKNVFETAISVRATEVLLYRVFIV